MKNNKKILIIILVCMILFVIIIGVINKIKKDNQVDLTADEMIDLMSYIPYSIVKQSNVDAYYGDLVETNDVLTTILSSSYLSLCIDVYELDDIADESIKKKFKESRIQYGIFLKKDVKNLLYKNFNLDLDYLKNIDDKVKIITIGEYIAFLPVKNDEFTVLNKSFIYLDSVYATKKSAKIIEKAVFFQLKDDKYYIYKDSNILNEDSIIKTYNRVDENGTELSGSDIAKIIKEDFQDYNYVFKHTFKKNKTGYYYYSTELIKEK